MEKLSPARRVFKFEDITQPGDYCLDVIEDNGVIKRHLWFLLPIHEGIDLYDHRASRGSGLHGISEPPWVFEVFEDGSVQARESIACGRREAEGEYWHGYLDAHNVWREL
jgi:hypothetical protein